MTAAATALNELAIPNGPSNTLVAALVALQDTPDGQQVAADLGMPGGFERMSHEDAEFMIDLMVALTA